MKKILFILSLVLFACHGDDDNPVAQIDLLPPATHTGENTFGCLLDGQAFLPDNLPGAYNCYYQFVGGDYYFNVGAGNTVNPDLNARALVLKTEKKQIYEGETYQLLELADGNAYGVLSKNGYYYTSQTDTGQLTITKLDFENNIVSGTFWYDVKDQNGMVHQIREGRFDMQFTQ